ncbi:uncharacterized protein LOC128158314 [Crassostrea angulata]|uniref:uncharacterized protein LOC128158314 n=1 Tax=Magallana angulata TaxID=2784310 RepID=UPI0022B0DAF5|nr:uncharacterized protein LOC128158314 [Crassostrea angulata]
MLNNTGKRLAFAFLVLTFIFWLISMVSPGWLLLQHIKYNMFYMERCTNDKCENKEYSDFFQKTPGFKITVTFQIKCLVALILCAISGILVVIPTKRSTTQYFIAVIIIPVAATLQCDLILTTALLNIIHGPFVKFPYSILLSGLGTLLSIVAWVICVIVYNNERNRESENRRHRMNHTEPLPLAELAF